MSHPPSSPSPPSRLPTSDFAAQGYNYHPTPPSTAAAEHHHVSKRTSLARLRESLKALKFHPLTPAPSHTTDTDPSPPPTAHSTADTPEGPFEQDRRKRESYLLESYKDAARYTPTPTFEETQSRIGNPFPVSNDHEEEEEVSATVVLGSQRSSASDETFEALERQRDRDRELFHYGGRRERRSDFESFDGIYCDDLRAELEASEAYGVSEKKERPFWVESEAGSLHEKVSSEPPLKMKRGTPHHTSELAELALNTSPTSSLESALPLPEERVYPKRRYFGLLLLILLNLLISFAWLTFAPIPTTTQSHFLLSSTTPVNWLSTSVFFAYLLAFLPTLYSLHHLSLRTTIRATSALMLLGFWLRYAGARASSYPLLLTGQILVGLAQPAVLATPNYFAAQWFSPSARTTVTAVVSLSNPLGAALAQLLAPIVVAEGRGGKLVGLLLGSAVLATAVAVGAVFIPEREVVQRKDEGEVRVKLTPKQSLLALLHNRQFVALASAFIVYLSLFNAFSTLLAQILVPHGLSEDQAGLCGALLIFVGLVVSMVVSPLADRYNLHLLTIRILVPITAICYLCLIFTPRFGGFSGNALICAVLGAASFALLPVGIEAAGRVLLMGVVGGVGGAGVLFLRGGRGI
ncbi:MFS general substrate transporter [Ascobolus immersus RN42]|uniref:MFS general substrate transporter n=1 Tax=Ascobolus immersus RN42 TaxID=1160509 RepID=A0A3N4HII1_ASCIM|nr:MFS general substrate transporter [Ascobolus immersus RN42]